MTNVYARDVREITEFTSPSLTERERERERDLLQKERELGHRALLGFVVALAELRGPIILVT